MRAAWAAAADSMRAAEIGTEAAALAQDAIQRQRRDLANMAHELKNPLNAISAYAQWLQMPQIGIDEAARKEKIATIEAAAKHSIELVGDLLTNEQLETGNLQIDVERFELAPLIEEVAALERSALEKGDNTLIIDLGENAGSLASDRRRVAQILINLLSNAAKFTKSGQVHLSLRRDFDAGVRISIADTGIGISPERKARLFEAFSSIGGRAAREAGGHGLGLHITLGLIARLGGNIEIDSEVDVGTIVTVWLPDLRIAGNADRTTDSATLTMAFTQILPSLDPMIQQVDADDFMLGTVYETLARHDIDGVLQAGLAKSWQQIDAVTWLIQLDGNARFHNGDPLGVADVLATFDRARRVLDTANLETMSTMPDVVAWEAFGDMTVRLRTRYPAPLFVNQLTFVPVIHRSAGNVPIGGFHLAHAIGTGPYRLVEYGAYGFRMVAKTRPGRADPHWKSILGRRFTAAVEAERALLGGEIDIMPHAGRDLARRTAQGSSIRTFHRPNNAIFFLQPNVDPAARGAAYRHDGTPIDSNPFADLRVRRAISLAIDRDFLCSHALFGHAQPLASPVPSHYFGADDSLAVDAYDPDQAQQLLAEAGFADGFIVPVRALDTVESDDRQILRSLQAQLQICGIRFQSRFASLRDFAAGDPAQGFGLILNSWIAPMADAEAVLRDWVAIRDTGQVFGACNYGNVAVPELDRALREAARCIDAGARRTLLRRACAIVAQECLLIPLLLADLDLACRGHLNIIGTHRQWIGPEQVVLREAEALLIDHMLAT